jgi:hypothetical protein
LIISVDAEKSFGKIQHLFMIKDPRRLEIEGIYLNIIKATYNRPIAKIIRNGEKLKPFLLKSGMREGCLFSPLLFSIEVGIPSQSNKARRRNKRNTTR